ncbi:AlpA family phage regulatory protein [Neisseria weixii]|uniref:AlpA family phage regulatory protein n=1 Tax=Neisseria weixii TaxID=1853276 RepID=A0A3N4NTK0_9NEIS|nr:AlpA family phage regulatory protein [Neisseria weixii]RPD90493.1 AlpA family phage regulatory protein [Neisseria weixii]RPD90565.1 AlpA family phage regulatory protein [Neisseria weixii]
MQPEKYTDRALRAKQVAEKLGVSIPFVWAKCNPDNTRYDASFPKPFKIAKNVTVWLESSIDRWLAAQAAETNPEKGAA